MTSTRLVSLANRSVAAIEYVVEAVDEFVRVTVQSELVTNEDQPQTSADPRVSAILDNPLEAVDHEAIERRRAAHAPDPGQRADDGRRDGSRDRRARAGRGRHRRA